MIPQRRTDDVFWERKPYLVPDQQLRWISGKGPAAWREELLEKLSFDLKPTMPAPQTHERADGLVEREDQPRPYTIMVHPPPESCFRHAWHGPTINHVNLNEEAPDDYSAHPEAPYEPPRPPPMMHRQNHEECGGLVDQARLVTRDEGSHGAAAEPRLVRRDEGQPRRPRRKGQWVATGAVRPTRIPLSPRFPTQGVTQSAAACRNTRQSACLRPELRRRGGNSLPTAAERAVPPAMQVEFLPFTGYHRDLGAALRPLTAKSGRRSPSACSYGAGRRTPEALLRPMTPAGIDRFL